MRIYLAARYERRAELAGYAERLRVAGYAVRSRWLEEKDQDTFEAITDQARRNVAVRDLIDIRECDLLVRFSEVPRSVPTTGGSLVEMGYALGRQTPVIVIGPRENVFHYLLQVEQYDSFEEFLQALHSLTAHDLGG